MEHKFQRADFEALMGMKVDGQERSYWKVFKLVDGQELFFGFVRIEADGLHMDNKPDLWEEPLFDQTFIIKGQPVPEQPFTWGNPVLDLNFNRGKPVLPFPFTLAQFKDFYAWHPLFRCEVIKTPFTNDDDTTDVAALATLDEFNLNTGMLVRSVLGIADDELRTWEQQFAIDECNAKIAEFDGLKVETISDSKYRDENLAALNDRLQSLLKRQMPGSANRHEQSIVSAAMKVSASGSVESDARHLAASRPQTTVFNSAPAETASEFGGVERDTGYSSVSQPKETTASPAPLVHARVKRRSWWVVASPYIVEIMQTGQYATVKELYKTLVAKAGSGSPFDKGIGNNRSDLFVRELATPLSLKTLQNSWRKLRDAAAQK